MTNTITVPVADWSLVNRVFEYGAGCFIEDALPIFDLPGAKAVVAGIGFGPVYGDVVMRFPDALSENTFRTALEIATDMLASQPGTLDITNDEYERVLLPLFLNIKNLRDD